MQNVSRIKQKRVKWNHANNTIKTKNATNDTKQQNHFFSLDTYYFRPKLYWIIFTNWCFHNYSTTLVLYAMRGRNLCIKSHNNMISFNKSIQFLFCVLFLSILFFLFAVFPLKIIVFSFFCTVWLKSEFHISESMISIFFVEIDYYYIGMVRFCWMLLWLFFYILSTWFVYRDRK